MRSVVPSCTPIRLTACGAAAGLVLGLSGPAGPAHAAAAPVEITARVLVLDDGQPMTAALTDRLTKEGVPFTRVDLTSTSRPQLTADFLASTQPSGTIRASFMGVVTPNEAPAQLTDAERATLASYERTFAVREVTAYTWAHPEVGLGYTSAGGYAGSVDGLAATVTDAGRAGPFGYLRGSLTLDDLDPAVIESYGYLATPSTADPAATFTPLVTATVPGTGTQGSLMGVYAKDGREQLITTFASNSGQGHWRTLSHGVLAWLTRGVSLSYQRNYLSVHIDDVLLPDSEWHRGLNCTLDDDCPPSAQPEDGLGTVSRMKPADVTALLEKQRLTGLKLDIFFNGAGAAEEKATNGGDALESSLLAAKSELRWANHTWSHPYLGCTQDYTTTPWHCATDATGATMWAPRSTIAGEIRKNKDYATTNALPGFRPDVLVTGEHSGLRSLPQMPTDNPNLAAALTGQGIRWVGSDASRERDPRVIGSATTVPRHPMNIFYNTSTRAQAIDEYNWLYNRRADGGSGLCEDNPQVSTCIAPLGADGFEGYIVPMNVLIAMSHVLDNDPRPHYAHQSNLTGDRVLYPVVDGIADRYGQVFAANTPLVNPPMQDAGAALVAQQTWAGKAAQVTALVSGRTLTVTNAGTAAVSVPITAPAGTRLGSATFGTPYAGQVSAWTQVGAGARRTLTLGADPGFATTATWPADATPAPAALVAPDAPTRPTRVVPVRALPSSVLEKEADARRHGHHTRGHRPAEKSSDARRTGE